MVRKTGIVLFAVILATSIGGCRQKEAVTFGAVLPLSGAYSLYGGPIQQGIELAHEQIMERYEDDEYPLPIKLEVRDSQGNPQTAAALLEELARQENAVAIIGGVTSAEALEMVEAANRVEKVLLSPSASSPTLSGRSRYFYRVFPSDFREGTKMGSFSALKLELKNVAILAANNPYSRGISRVFRNEFERYDGEVLDEIVYPDGTTDFTEAVDQVIALKPQAVYVADFAEQVRQILDKLAERGFQGTLLTTSAFATQDVIDAAGERAEGVILSQTVFDPNSEDPTVKAFAEAYEAKYGEKPTLFAAHGYDAMMVLAEALKEGGRMQSEFWKGMRSLQNYEGVTGQIQFDEKGDVGKFPRVYIVQDGQLQDYDQVVEEKRRQLIDRLERIRKERERALRSGSG